MRTDSLARSKKQRPQVSGTLLEPGAWRRLLAPSQAAEVENVAGEELRRVGYGS